MNSEEWRKKFISEIDSKGQSIGYKEMEALCESYKKTCQNLEEQQRKSNEQLRRDLCHKNRMVSLLAKEVIKYNPSFNFFQFEEEHFGKLE